MPLAPLPTVTITPVAYFPKGSFVENLAVRRDGSVLVSSLLHKQLWCAPGPEPSLEGEPVVVHTFDNIVMGMVEAEPETFIVSLSDGYTTHESHLARLDLTGWTPGRPVAPEIVYTFDYRARALNGSCLLASGVMLVADCFAGLIWRVDLDAGARHARARIWCEHPTMRMDPDSDVAPPPQPGVNGIRFGPKTGYLYYTSTAQQVFMRIPVNPVTLDPEDRPEFVAAINNTDDFCIDEVAGFAYVTRHRGNTIDQVPLAPGHGSEVRHVAGDPFDDQLVGPSSAAWGPGPTDPGRVAYVTVDGGRTAPPPDGIVRDAALLRIELQPAPAEEAPAYATVSRP